MKLPTVPKLYYIYFPYGLQRVLTDPMEAAYFGVKLWGKVVQEAQSIDPTKIRLAMHNQSLRAPGVKFASMLKRSTRIKRRE